MELKKYKLADIGKVITGKTPSTSIAENYAWGTIPFYTPEDVAKGLGMMGRNSRFISKTGFEEIASNTISGESVLVGCIGSDMGNVAYSNITCATNQQINAITQFKNGIDPLYVYYLLSTMKSYFQKIAGSTTTPILPKSIFEEIEIHLPDMKKQKDVVSILYALDRKIELNKQINDNLEAMAKQLYDYWFVQFDFPNEEGKPYKSSGGAMVWNEKLKREIPQEWSNCKLKEFINLFDSKRVPLSSKDRGERQGVYPYYGATGIMDYVNDYIFDGDYILLAEDGSTSDAKGLPIVQYIWGKNWVNNHAHIILPKNERYMMFTYQMLRSIPAKQIETGSIQKKISQENLCGYKMALPNSDLLEKYENVVSPLWEKRKRCIEEINTLTKQRDELLPLLMNGQASVNYHLCVFQSFRILYRKKTKNGMKETVIKKIVNGMQGMLTQEELECLGIVVRKALSACEVVEVSGAELQQGKDNAALLDVFISAKKIEGCSEKTLQYYKSSIEKLVMAVGKNVCETNTNDIRCYLADLQEKRGLSKVTMDNLRRIYSSFFSWLEDEDYITKSPVRRIHKVRTDALVKEVLTDENIEVLRDSCHELRDIAMIDLLLSTGMRVGELVRINREDVDLHERQCVVFGKGNKEREVYFNARAKIHLKKYLEQRTDDNPALFVSLKSPYNRLTINGVEVRLRKLGAQANIATKVHPHKFRRTLATMAIDKGMPIEQVQKMLGHVKIDTTMHYAMVNQANVKIAHRKFIN